MRGSTEATVRKEKQNSLSLQFYKNNKLACDILPSRNEEAVSSDLPSPPPPPFFFWGKWALSENSWLKFYFSSASRTNVLRPKLNGPEGSGPCSPGTNRETKN